jgi:hypothetical protein
LQRVGEGRAVISRRRRDQELLRIRFGQREDLVDHPSELERSTVLQVFELEKDLTLYHATKGSSLPAFGPVNMGSDPLQRFFNLFFHSGTLTENRSD